MVAALQAREPAVFYVNGPGGTGKSFLFETLLRRVRGDIAVAYGGRICHAHFGFPCPFHKTMRLAMS